MEKETNLGENYPNYLGVGQESNLLFKDHRFLLYRSMKDYIEDYFLNCEGLKECWSDVTKKYREYKNLDRLGIESLLDEDLGKRMREAEWYIDVALLGYYAKNHLRVKMYPRLKDKTKTKIIDKIFSNARELKIKKSQD